MSVVWVLQWWGNGTGNMCISFCKIEFCMFLPVDQGRCFLILIPITLLTLDCNGINAGRGQTLLNVGSASLGVCISLGPHGVASVTIHLGKGGNQFAGRSSHSRLGESGNRVNRCVVVGPAGVF